MTAPEKLASVRYLVDDVEAAVTFYTTHLGFTVHTDVAPAFADVIRGPLRLLLSGPTSSGARATPADATAAGRNRIHLVVDDLDTEIDRLRRAGLSFRSDLVTGPGGRQILLADPAGNLIELFQPLQRQPAPTASSRSASAGGGASDGLMRPLEGTPSVGGSRSQPGGTARRAMRARSVGRGNHGRRSSADHA